MYMRIYNLPILNEKSLVNYEHHHSRISNDATTTHTYQGKPNSNVHNMSFSKVQNPQMSKSCDSPNGSRSNDNFFESKEQHFVQKTSSVNTVKTLEDSTTWKGSFDTTINQSHSGQDILQSPSEELADFPCNTVNKPHFSGSEEQKLVKNLRNLIKLLKSRLLA